jgi:endonuclease VIII
MPEGDNIHAHAAELSSLVGEPLTAVWARAVEMRGLRGRSVARVDAVGKHLVIAFDEGSAVRVHLGIAGSWRHRRRASTATLAQAELALATAHGVWLCSARTLEWSRARLMAGARALSRLGPDLLADAPDLDQVIARAREARHAARPIGELLLDQTIAAGLGNVYKCELLFLHGVSPWARVDAVEDATLRALFADGIKWLRANVGRTRTTTADASRGERPVRGRGRLWVYGRWRRACYRCGTAIAQRRQRPSLRPTYYCPRCQPESSSGASAS